MDRGFNFLALARLTVVDPIEGARVLIALRWPMAVRWMLLAAAVLASVVVLYALPVMAGVTEGMPSPVMFAGAQVALNLIVVLLITHVGAMFGGKGRFEDALLLVGWLQVLTVGLLIVQLGVLVVVPALNLPVTLAAVALSLWILTGFVCALHGFASRLLVLMGGVAVFVSVSFVLSFILLLLGFDPSGGTNV
jgi:hypothetical protein